MALQTLLVITNVLKCSYARDHLEGVLKLAGPTPLVSDSVHLGICILADFPSHAGATLLRITL